jgi:hypothetical protein
MWRRFLQALTALLVTVGLCAAEAQPEPESYQPGTPIPEFALALLATLIVLVIVCMPSRKQ